MWAHFGTSPVAIKPMIFLHYIHLPSIKAPPGQKGGMVSSVKPPPDKAMVFKARTMGGPCLERKDILSRVAPRVYACCTIAHVLLTSKNKKKQGIDLSSCNQAGAMKI